MTLFKKKAAQPALFFVLEQELKKAQEKGYHYFLYPLWKEEVDKARAWALRHHLFVEVDHKTDNNLFYKFFGIN